MDTFASTDLTRFIARIYDTIVNQDSWSSVLDEFAVRCGAVGSTLMLGDLTNQEISLRPVSSVFDPIVMAEFERLYGQEDAVAMSYVARFAPMTWVSEEEAWGKPAEDINANRFLGERLGLGRRFGARLNDTPIWIDGVSLNFRLGQGSLTPEGRDVSSLLLPHFAKAVEISRPFILLRTRFNAVLSVLDRLQIGISIVGPGLEVIVSNKEAKRILESNDGIILSKNSKVVISDQEAGTRLTAAVQRLTKQQGAVEKSTLLSVPKRSKDSQWLLEAFRICELTGEIDGAFVGAAIYFIDPDRKDIVSTAGIDELFGLTPSEKSVCDEIVNGLTLPEIAERKDRSYETIRNQAKAVFDKTGARRQSDIVRLALKTNLPVDRPESDTETPQSEG